MKTDARVRYTRMRIQEAFFACLREKTISRITVKELCERAEINRATFYKHYADPFDLLEKLEEQTLHALEETIRRPRRPDQSVLLMILRNIRDPQNEYALLASQNGDPSFAAKLSGLFYAEFQPRMAEHLPGRTPDEQKAAYFFVTGGCGYLLARWIQSGMQAEPEAVAAQLRELCGAFVAAYGGNA